MTAWLHFVPLAGIGSALGDGRAVGEATLIALAAIVIGFLVRRFWPSSMSPVLSGILSALAFIATLAVLGLATAALVLYAALAVAVVALALAFALN